MACEPFVTRRVFPTAAMGKTSRPDPAEKDKQESINSLNEGAFSIADGPVASLCIDILPLEETAMPEASRPRLSESLISSGIKNSMSSLLRSDFSFPTKPKIPHILSSP